MRALGCFSVALLTSAGFAMPVAARSAPPTLRVAGPAGSSYWVEVSAGTQLANAGDYSTTDALETAGETVFRIGLIEEGPRGCTVSGEGWAATHNA